MINKFLVYVSFTSILLTTTNMCVAMEPEENPTLQSGPSAALKSRREMELARLQAKFTRPSKLFTVVSGMPPVEDQVRSRYKGHYIEGFLNAKDPKDRAIKMAAEALYDAAVIDHEPSLIILKKFKGSPAFKAAQNGKTPKKIDKEYKLAQAYIEYEKSCVFASSTPSVLEDAPKNAVVSPDNKKGNEQLSPKESFLPKKNEPKEVAKDAPSPAPKASAIFSKEADKMWEQKVEGFANKLMTSYLDRDQIDQMRHTVSEVLPTTPLLFELFITKIEQMIAQGTPPEKIQKFQRFFLDATCPNGSPAFLKFNLNPEVLERLGQRFFHSSQHERNSNKKIDDLRLALNITTTRIFTKTRNTSLDWDSDLSCKNLFLMLEKDQTDYLLSYHCFYSGLQTFYSMNAPFKAVGPTVLREVLLRGEHAPETLGRYILTASSLGKDVSIFEDAKHQYDLLRPSEEIVPTVIREVLLRGINASDVLDKYLTKEIMTKDLLGISPYEFSPSSNSPKEHSVPPLTEKTPQQIEQESKTPGEDYLEKRARLDAQRKAEQDARDRELHLDKERLLKNPPQNFSSPSPDFLSLPKTPEPLPTPLDPKKKETPPSSEEKQGIKQKIKKILPKSPFLKKDKEKDKKKEKRTSPTESLGGDGSASSQETSAKPELLRTKSLSDLSKPRRKPELNRTYSLMSIIPNKKRPESTETTSSEGTLGEGKPLLRRSSSKKLPKAPTFGEYKRRESQKKLARRDSVNLNEASQEEPKKTTFLVNNGTFPLDPDTYSKEQLSLLANILVKKFDLGSTDLNTLWAILQKERSFEVSLDEIKTLFSRFEGITGKIYQGGNHEKISGLGLTLPPNADGIKKGSYNAIINQAREAIFNRIVPTLTVDDLLIEDNSRDSSKSKDTGSTSEASGV